MSQFQIPNRDAFTASGFIKRIDNPNFKKFKPVGPENPEQINTALNEKFETDIAQLFGNTMGSFNDYVTSDLQNLNLINQRSASDTFRSQIGQTKVDEPLEKLASTHRGQIYFKPDGTMGKGPLGFWEVSDASNLFQGNFGLLGTEASAMSEKANIYGTNSLLQKSKAWPKLQEALTISEEDKEQLKDWFEADNNWDRAIEIDNLKDLFEFVPITSQILGLTGETPEEKFLQRKDPNFKAGDLVAAIQTYDPDFYSFLVDEGVDIDKLSKAENPFHFRFLINYRIQSNAIQRSMNAVEKYHSTAVNWALWGADQMRASLTSADFVAQIALTVATAGLGAVVSGAATSINMARGGLQGVQTTINTATKLRALGQSINNVRKYLPLQLPTTVLERVAPTLVRGNLPSGFAGVGALTLGHAITGAAEEGLTDVINQAYELNTGIRVSYNFDQTMLAAGTGAVLEPILGGAFKVASIPINITLSGVSRLGNIGVEKTFSYSFGVDPSRFRELGLYMDAVTGKGFNELSPDEAEERIRIIANRLAIEAALNRATNNTFGKIEQNTELLGFLHAILKSDKLATSQGIQQGITTLAAKVLSIKEDLDSSMVQDKNGNWIRKSQLIAQQAPSLFTVDENGFIQFTKQGVEALLVSMAVDNITTDAQRTEAISTTILDIVMNNQRKILLENEGFKAELEKITDPEKREELIRDRLMEMVSDPNNTEIQDRITELQSLFDLISQHLPESKVAVNEEQNLEPETTAAFKEEAATLDEENNKAVDDLLEDNKPKPSVSEAAPAAPEAASAAPEIEPTPTPTQTPVTPPQPPPSSSQTTANAVTNGFNAMGGAVSLAAASDLAKRLNKVLDGTMTFAEFLLDAGIKPNGQTAINAKIVFDKAMSLNLTNIDGQTYLSLLAETSTTTAAPQVAPAAVPEAAPAAPEAAPVTPEVVPTTISSEPTPGTTLSILKHGQEKDQLLGVEAAAAGKKPLTGVNHKPAIKRARELGLVEYPPPKELGLVENLPPEELQNEYESFKIFGLPNEDSKKAAEEYYKLLPTPRSPERTTKIGKLYGYTDQEIANLISGKAAPAAPAAAPVATEAAPVATEAAPSVTPTTKLLDANDMQDLPVELQNLIKTFKNC